MRFAPAEALLLLQAHQIIDQAENFLPINMAICSKKLVYGRKLFKIKSIRVNVKTTGCMILLAPCYRFMPSYLGFLFYWAMQTACVSNNFSWGIGYHFMKWCTQRCQIINLQQSSTKNINAALLHFFPEVKN